MKKLMLTSTFEAKEQIFALCRTALRYFGRNKTHYLPKPTRLSVVAQACLLVSGISYGDDVEVHFLDVRIGDAIIIDSGQHEIIIDGGRDKDVLMEYIESTGIVQSPIELLVLTHADGDHWRGLERLVDHENLDIAEFWDPGFEAADDCETKSKYRKFVKKVENKLADNGLLRPIEEFHDPATSSGRLESFSVRGLPGITFQLLHASQSPKTEQERSSGFGGRCAYKINNASIVMMLEVNGAKLLFTGDANGKFKEKDDPTQAKVIDVEQALLELNKTIPNLLKADLLKVPHHGSETANSQAFIEAVDPKYAIFSATSFVVGKDLPRPTVVERYRRQGSLILRTDRNSKKNKDHIVCTVPSGALLSCRYKFQ